MNRKSILKVDPEDDCHLIQTNMSSMYTFLNKEIIYSRSLQFEYATLNRWNSTQIRYTFKLL